MERTAPRASPTRKAVRAARSQRATPTAWPAWPQTLMVAHVVLFKVRPGLDAEARQGLASAFERALREIPSIRRAQIGRRVTHGRPYEQLMTVDYEYAAILEFDDVAGLKAYLADPAHEALGARFFDSFEVALMYDYEIGRIDELLAQGGPKTAR